MPRAVDRYQLEAEGDPTRSGTEFHLLMDQRLTEMWGQIMEQVVGNSLEGVMDLIKEITGLDFSSPEAFVSSLIQLVTTGGPALEFAESILDLLGSFVGIPNLGDFLQEIAGALEGIDISSPGAIIQTIIGVIANSPLNALNIFGNLPSYLLGEVPASALGSASPNLLSNPGFEGAISMDDEGGWVWDATTGHTSNGCAKTTANSTLKALQSNGIAVTPNQQIDLSVWVQTTSYVGTGTPIKLGVRTYSSGSVVDTSTLAQRAATPSWTEMSGTYTVPASGVDSIRMRLIVDTTATGGDVRFDDAEVRKPGNGPFDGLLSLFGLSSLEEFLDLDPDSVWSLVVTTILNPLSLLEDNVIRDFVKQFLDTLTSVVRLIPFVGDDIADSLDNFADGMTAQTETVIGTAATTSQILAALGSGVPDADDFERSSLGSNWRVITSNGGSATCDGHDLVMAHSDTTDFILLKTNKLAGSDFQTSEIVLGSAPGFDTILLDSARGHNDIWLRCTDFTTWSTRTGVRCRWSASNKNIRLSAWVNGSEVVTLYNAAASSASAGSRLSLEAGVNGTQRRFVIRINGSVIPNGDIVESGTASQYGASYRTRGLGGRTEKLGIDPLSVSPDPGRLKQWTATG